MVRRPGKRIPAKLPTDVKFEKEIPGFAVLVAERRCDIVPPSSEWTVHPTEIASVLAAIDELRSEFLFTLTVSMGERQEVGATPFGHRRIFAVTGGAFEGPKLKGQLLAGGGDWATVRADGARVLDVRQTLRSDDGELIYMRYDGLVYGAPDVLARFAEDPSIEPSEYYFRIAPHFETASKKYAWLNNLLAVGVGRRLAKGVAYSIHAIL